MLLKDIIENARPFINAPKERFEVELSKVQNLEEVFAQRMVENPIWRDAVEANHQREGEYRVWYLLERCRSNIDRPNELALFILDYGQKPTIIVTCFEQKG